MDSTSRRHSCQPQNRQELGEDDEEEEECLFRPLTTEHVWHERLELERNGRTKLSQKFSFRRNLSQISRTSRGDDCRSLSPDPHLEAGCKLPTLIRDFLPRQLIGVPLQDIDPYYRGKQTFIVVSKGRILYRFNSERALCLMDPFNALRRTALNILTHSAFSLVIMLTILANCVVMAMPRKWEKTLEKSEVFFTVMYSIEACVKMTARGFALAPFTYVRDPWNMLDFVVISCAYLTLFIELGNVAILRTFRVLRALKTVAIIPGLKTIVATVIESVKNLLDVIILTMFSLSVFALIGLQIYMGILTQKCIRNYNGTFSNQLADGTVVVQPILLNDTAWFDWNNQSDNWYIEPDKADYFLCGNKSGAAQCPADHTCLEGFGLNPNYGYTSFDTFGLALLASFRLMTQDYWENLFQLVIRTAGSVQLLFFVVAIFMNSYYLLNLILAIVAMSYDQLQQRVEEEKVAEKADMLKLAERKSSKRARRRSVRLSKRNRDGLRPTAYGDNLELCSEMALTQFQPATGDVRGGASQHRVTVNGHDDVSLTSHRYYQDLQLIKSANEECTENIACPQEQSGRSSRSSHQMPWLVTDHPLGSLSGEASVTRYADESNVTTPSPQHGNNSVVQRQPSRRISFSSNVSVHSFDSHTESYSQRRSNTQYKDVPLNDSSTSSLESVMDAVESDSSFYHDSKQLTGKHKFGPSKNNTGKSIEMKDIIVLNKLLDEADDSDSDTDSDSEEMSRKKRLKRKISQHMNAFIDKFCIWNCCEIWCRFQKMLGVIAFDPFVDLFITVCILVNTLFMAMDHQGMDRELARFLDSGNHFFTAIFMIEAIVKLMVLSPKLYFHDSWNVFDFIIVVLSLVELAMSGAKGLRSSRMLRVFKLAKNWPTLNLLITIMGQTVGAIGNLTIVLCIIIFIFAVMGMQLFGEEYPKGAANLVGGEIPRWNFIDFMHSFMIVFRVLCGEWIESMWDCLQVAGSTCVPFFLATVVIANLVVLSLFLALLLSSFGASSLSMPTSKAAKSGKLGEAVQRLNRWRNWIAFQLKRLLCCCFKSKTRPSASSGNAADGEDMVEFATRRSALNRLSANRTHSLDNALKLADRNIPNECQVSICQFSRSQSCRAFIDESNGKTNIRDAGFAAKVEAESVKPKVISPRHDRHKFTPDGFGKASTEETTDSVTEAISPTTTTTETTAATTATTATTTASTVTAPVADHTPPDCFPPLVYSFCRCCVTHSLDPLPTTKTEGAENGEEGNNSDSKRSPDDKRPTWCQMFWYQWGLLRCRTHRLTENNYFELAVIFMIMLSSLSLALEDVHLKDRPLLQDILYYMDRIFTGIFFLEMIIKWVAMGFNQYFRNAWCWLDFFIVMVSLINLGAVALKMDGASAFKTMRTLRALRPLRAMSRMAGMKVVVNALIQAIPSIFNVFLVCAIFWLVFAIIGVQFFKGKFYKCLDEYDKMVLPEYVANKSQCNESLGYTWRHSLMTFDDVGSAYLSLFQVATFKGWIPIMSDAVDSREINQQPVHEYKVVRYLFFVLFIVCGAFFTLNLFIGVIIDNFNEQKKKMTGGSLEMFMTEDQKKYYKAMKKMKKKKPQKAIPIPKFYVQRYVYDICMNRKFDITIMIFIGLNMLIMMLDEYRMSEYRKNILEKLNLLFIVIFTAEGVLKMFAFRWHYFRDAWNTFDFIVITLSILGVVLSDVFTKIFNVPPTLLRVVRVAKVTRVLRLIKGAKGIRTLLFAFAMSAPALLNIIMLLFLMLFIYAIFGMSFFMHVKIPKGALDATFNFQTFIGSFTLLFQMMTSAGWDGVLEGLTNTDDCEPADESTGFPGSCGTKSLGVGYLISFLIISFLIVINMYIAVILENYSQAKDDVQEGLTDDDYDMYYEIWQRFDPKGTKFIPLNKMSDLLDQLEPPLQVPTPNKFRIVTMNIPIYEGDRVWCVHILDSLTKDFFARKGTDISQSQVEPPPGTMVEPPLKRISTTMWRNREEHCAQLIQRLWRHYARRRAHASMSNPTTSPESSVSLPMDTVTVSRPTTTENIQPPSTISPYNEQVTFR